MTLTPASRAALAYVASFSVPYLTPSEFRACEVDVRQLCKDGLVEFTIFGSGWACVRVTKRGRGELAKVDKEIRR